MQMSGMLSLRHLEEASKELKQALAEAILDNQAPKEILAKPGACQRRVW